MNNIIQWLESLKLSLIQWAGLSAALIIGSLVAALEIQGGRLHKAQVELLRVRANEQIGLSDAAVAQAKQAFEAERKAYYEANQI